MPMLKSPAGFRLIFVVLGGMIACGSPNFVAFAMNSMQQIPADSVKSKQAEIAQLIVEGNQALSSGNAANAAESYKKALQLDPGNPKLHYNLSVAFYKLGDLASERSELIKATELDPRFAIAQNQLGLLALQVGQLEEAARRFKLAIVINPKFAEAQCNLGTVYSQQGKPEAAASLFRQAIKNDPKSAQAHLNLGLLLSKKGDSAEAEKLYRTALQIEPDDPDTYAALGSLLAKTNRASEAIASLQRAVALDPNSAEDHLELGVVLLDQFDRAAAFKELTESARLNPNLAAAHYNLGRFFVDDGKYEEAERELETAIRLKPDYVGALYYMAVAARQQNQLKRSTELLQKIVALQAGNADAQYLLGQNFAREGDDVQAVEHWKAALSADPNLSPALYNLAKVLRKMHDPAAQQYQDRFDALAKSQDIADRMSELGNSALEAASRKDWPKVIEQMDEAIKLCGDCPQEAHLHKNLAFFDEQMGNFDGAKKELGIVLQLVPNDEDAKNSLAEIETNRPAGK